MRISRSFEKTGHLTFSDLGTDRAFVFTDRDESIVYLCCVDKFTATRRYVSLNNAVVYEPGPSDYDRPVRKLNMIAQEVPE